MGQKEEHHDDAMYREQLVVGIGSHQIAGRSQQFEPNQCCRGAANRKKEDRRDQVNQRDTFVVLGQQPRFEAVLASEVIVCAAAFRAQAMS